MAVFGSVEQGYLGRLIASGHKTGDDFFDMRGFDWSDVPHNRKVYPTYYEEYILKVDFSSSKSDEGFEIRGAVFEECVFDKSKWWCASFPKCKFINCSFNDCCLYNSKLGGKFYDCSFKNFALKTFRNGLTGFSWGSEYKNCIFENVNIRNQYDVIGLIFEGCKIDGIFKGGIFRGRRYALKERFRTPPDLFDTRYRPVKFIRCDLSNLKTQNVVFEKDIVFKDNKVGSQSFFT
jgi:uncharacterized protein YjbI with pentapeptide repeats